MHVVGAYGDASRQLLFDSDARLVCEWQMPVGVGFVMDGDVQIQRAEVPSGGDVTVTGKRVTLPASMTADERLRRVVRDRADGPSVGYEKRAERALVMEETDEAEV